MELRSVFVFILLIVFKAVSAQVGNYKFSHLTVKDGLPHNQINCVFKDDKGFLWFGTMAGLARFDGYAFKVYQHKLNDSSTIGDNDVVSITQGPGNKLWVQSRAGMQVYDPKKDRFYRRVWDELRQMNINENSVRKVFRDKKGSFWFIPEHAGLYHYNPKSNRSSYFQHQLKNSKSLAASPIIDLAEGPNGEIWVIHADGLLEQIEPVSKTVVKRIRGLANVMGAENDTYRLFVDKQGWVWIYNTLVSGGMFYVDPVKGQLVNINKNSVGWRLNSNIISGIVQVKNNEIWIATDHGGINIIDKASPRVKYIANNEDSDKDVIGQNNLSSIYYDNLGTVWIGTYRRGISYYHPGIVKFPLIKPSSASNSLVYNDVNYLAEDKKGNLWIATNGKGIAYFDRQRNTFKTYRHDPGNANSLSHDAIVSLYVDKGGKLWVGTYSGGLDCFDGQRFSHYRNIPNDPTSLSDNRVAAIYEDSSDRFWVLTMGGGINLFDRSSNKFKRLTVQSKDLKSNYVFSILEDSKKNLWFGTGYGLAILPYKSTRFKSIINTADSPEGLINNTVNCLVEDKKGNILIGTREGLSLYNPRSQKFKNFTTADGLPDNNIQGMEMDAAGYFWLSTSNGLSKVAVRYEPEVVLECKNFDESDGLQGKEFNRNASLKLKSGELAFGGADGFNLFDPAKVKTFNTPARLFITGFQLFNRPVQVDERIDGSVLLSTSITETKSVTLKSYQNVFTIEFASLNYIEPHKVKHQYMMEGFDKGWINADNSVRKATYTNLDAGDYVFKVRASNPDGRWTAKPVELHIRILPPFYKSNFAYFIYLLMIAGGLYLLRQRGIEKLKRQFAAEQEKKEVQRLLEQEKLEVQRVIEQERMEAMRFRELDALKIKFLTNISHEFRTPLSLILAPIDKLLKQLENSQAMEQVLVIQRNARRLLSLVNQLLDFRRMELNELKLQKRTDNIVSFVKEIALSFKDIAEQKNIQLSFNSSSEEVYTAFDHDKVERILFNLISNAFKFTLENGKVNVSLDLTAGRDQVTIKVRDTGIGIAADKQEKIFDSFFQSDVPDAIINQGSGIGLSIAKEFAKLHGGDIQLESELNFGSCFTVFLPVEELSVEESSDDFIEEIITEGKTADAVLQPADVPLSAKKLTVLILEDDVDFRFYLKDNLKEEYNVIEAGNGKDGWQKALFHHPNIIVSDISMPEMDGIEFCKKVKNDSRTFHIPIILLTAAGGEEQQIKGLGSGANDYMTKPFSFEILHTKIRNMIRQQESFKKTYQKQVEIKPLDVEVESPDEKFLQDVIKELEKNMSNSNFSVDELSSLLFVSRVTLYKRILNLTGKTPLEFIKSYRLNRAVQLLERGDFTISQICYKVGFKTSKNFVKSFKAEFGVIPSKYVENRELLDTTD
ncbi:hybrid sensor histidine kinase/response regulator transcription factor [Pedobacter sp. SYSU D00535]|uniref:hybrid sensor histidine kinase/response regulator transcription factor n=1 Tax=Pedobacter sp. SYSU D00535 TaxID=2810308 RepID=UPI001A975361|nr:hybrid sensor histidine kinase/response regulator transcription factor [Pedobacter sp. SYSU D00535]